MATYAVMSQVEARAELSRRGLIIRGLLSVLRERLMRDDTRREFRGDLTNVSLEYLKDGCALLSINNRGSREEILERIEYYNSIKRQRAGNGGS